MKFFFHGLLVGLGLLASVSLTGCGTSSGGNALFLDTPHPRADSTAATTSANPESFFTQPQQQSQPEQAQEQELQQSPSRQPVDTESFFQHAPTQSDVARFRVGQTVSVIFSGPPEPIPPFEEVIKEDGTITMPLIGRIYAVGKTAGELQNEIYTNYVPRYYVHLTVTVRAGDRVYYVGGEVGHAGVFQYISDTTVTKAIQAAGGLTPFSSHSRIWLTHVSTGKRIKVDYDAALRNPAKDPPVYPDDQINVEASAF